MREQDWALLGIAPTTKQGAIKKAYALKLKVTRPDDDAEAYQALRGAYERAQQWVKWALRSTAEADDAHDTPAADLATAEAETAPPVQSELSEQEPEHTIQPHHLIDELELQWQGGGEPALMSAWDEALCELNDQPFRRQAEFSAAFARWVLDLPDLPDEFLRALASHFGWTNDFKAERLLGSELVYELHEKLDARWRCVNDPGAVALAAPLLGFDALRKAGGRRLRLLLLSCLMEPTFARSRKLLSEQCLYQLGLDWNAQHELREAALGGIWLRVAMLTLACMAAAMQARDDAFIGIVCGLIWFLGTGAAMFAGVFIGSLASLLKLGPPVDQLSRHRHQSTRGLACLLFAAYLAYLAATPNAATTTGMLSWVHPWAWAIACAAMAFALAGLALAWPVNELRSWVVAGLAPLVGFLSIAALGVWLPPICCMLLGATWTLMGAALYEGHLAVQESSPVRWLLLPILNSLALADRWTYVVALLPLSVAFAWVVITGGQVGALRLFLVWVLSIQAVGWLQLKADTWGLRQLQPSKTGNAP